AQFDFVRVNDSSLHLLGFAASDLESKPLTACFSEPQNKHFQAEMQKAKLEMQHKFEIAMLKASGEFVETLWSVLWSERENAYFCVV
ncbi:hypothetical protein ACXYUI_29730, partial [Klebsiella pneumoniae]